MQLQTVAILVPSDAFLNEATDLFSEITKIMSSLKCLGYEIKKISLVEEVDRTVALELTVFSKLYDIVIVLASTKSLCVSKALGNMTIQELQNISFGYNDTDSIKWPVSIKLLKTKNNICPILYFQRIFILTLGESCKQFSYILQDHLKHYRKPAVYLKAFDIPKNGIRSYLEEIQFENVNITVEGQIENDMEKDQLLLHSNSFESIVNAENSLRGKLGRNISNGSWINQMQDLIYECSEKHIKNSIEVIEECLEKYGLENVFLSFNGGKDCTVLLHLVQTIVDKKYPGQKQKIKMFCLYVGSKNAFKEQDEFIEYCKIFFNLEIMYINDNIKEALRSILERKPNLKACFMGTRRTDPYSSNLNVFEPTDPDWPQIMRCNPLLDWFYSDIWDYLLYYKVPYCKLYDYGFTSLGNTLNTIRNPSLLFNSGGNDVYLPAFKLLNEKKERSGRSVSKI